jgi:hypothetical protein
MDGKSFLSIRNSRCSAGKASGCAEFAFAEFSSEFDHDKHSKFLLSLRSTGFAGEEGLFLGLACLDETATNCLFRDFCAMRLDVEWLPAKPSCWSKLSQFIAGFSDYSPNETAGSSALKSLFCSSLGRGDE